MRSAIKKIWVLIIAAAMILVPLTSSSIAATEYEKDDMAAEKMAADLVAIRPVAIVGTIVGFTVYLVSLPFSIPGGNSQEVWETTVVTPAKFAFVRPLGDF
ncbi:MAG: hypothetical protein RBT11_09435 [Desulfobacterales bacterium]|jgi:hypothetical protein|nr:hypothetical protein [Desulfobacterales bacterium]